MRWLETAVRLLLVCYPRDVRDRYGGEMAETVVARARSARDASGWRGVAAVAARECLGLVAAGLRNRWRRGCGRAPSSGPDGRRRRRGAGPWLDDVRTAARGLVRRPGMAVLSASTLALGIGATIAIFTVFYAVLLRPLPFHEPDRLVAVWERSAERGWDRAQVAAANYLDWRDAARSFADMAAHNDWLDEIVLGGGDEPLVVLGNRVTGNYFDVLGVAPAEGRLFDDGHTWWGREPVVVLSQSLRERAFGTGHSIVGRAIELDGVSHRVVGVVPSGFAAPFADTELWLPMAWKAERRSEVSFRRAHGLRVIGRLAPGATLEQAEAELSAIANRLEADYPETNQGMGTGITPLHEWTVGSAATPLLVLMAAVGFVLLIACVNVSNMLLVRASARSDELRIRSALGGGRRRLVLEGLLESLLLSALGGGLGLALGVLAVRPLLASSPEGLPRIDEIGVDATVVLVAIGLSLGCGAVLGALPAWRAASTALTAPARGASAGRRSRRASSLLVAAEVALTLPLVVGAGLMVRTLVHLSRVEPGFVADGVLVASVILPASRYEAEAARSRFYRRLTDRIDEMPGVEHGAVSAALPFRKIRWTSDFTAEGWPPDRYGMNVRHDEVSPGLFRALGVPLLRGRDFAPSDDRGSPPVVIVNQALVERYFDGEEPLGRRVAFDRRPGESSTWRTIVGVVGNVRRQALSLEEEPRFYAPMLQDPTLQAHLVVRSTRDPAELIELLRGAVRAIDPTLPLFDVASLETIVRSSMAQERFLLVLLGSAAGIALLLTTVGIFGVVLHATTTRVREIGIRIALGARAGSVVALVVAGGLGPVLAGTVLGVLAALALSHALGGFLFEVQPLDPVTFACVIAIVLSAALAACALPARRATRVDATTALRAE